MADELTGTLIARNLVNDPRLTHTFTQATQVTQTLVDGGGVDLALAAGQSDGYVTPWAGETLPDGDVICVLIMNPAAGLSPAGGATLTPGGDGVITWLRGTTSGYQYTTVIRTSTPKTIRLHVPDGGKPLRVAKSGVFTIDSWEAMQQRNLVYFDGGGLVYANEDSYTLPPATTVSLGGVIVGNGLQITPQGVLSAVAQSLRPATDDTLGGIMIGQGLQSTAAGLVSVKLGSGLEYDSTGAIIAPEITPPDLSDYYTKTESDGRYYTRDLADATFQKIDSSGKGYLTQDTADNRYLQKSEASSTYMTRSDAANNYVSQTDMPIRFAWLEVSGSSDGNAMRQVSFNNPSGTSGRRPSAVFVTDYYPQDDTHNINMTWKIWSLSSGSITLRAVKTNGTGWATGMQTVHAFVLLVWSV